jgi:sec-independent protein translocase protein TatA
MLAFLGNLGGSELLIILFIVVLLFGARKLPELAQSMGSSVQAFKKGMRDGAEEPKKAPAEQPKSDAASNGQH